MTLHAGATPEQRAAHAAYNRAWAASNRDRHLATRRAREKRVRAETNARRRLAYLVDGAAERDRAARWYDANRERAAANARAYAAAHRAEARRRRRRWEDAVPIRTAACRAAGTANRRARDAGAQGQIGYETVLELWRRQPVCIDCGEGRGVDHVIPFCRGGSNTSGNLANRCRWCNCRKGRRLPSELAA